MIENLYSIFALISGLFVVIFGVVTETNDDDEIERSLIPTIALKVVGWITVLQSVIYLVI